MDLRVSLPCVHSRLAGASRPDLVAADVIYSVPPPRNLVSVAFFRFVAARIGCTATPDSWSLIAFGGRDLRAERVRGHPMVALLGPWRPGWPPRPWSSSWTDLSSHIGASRGCSESSFVLVRASVCGSMEFEFAVGDLGSSSLRRQQLSSTSSAMPEAVRAAAAGCGTVVARASGRPRRVDRSRVSVDACNVASFTRDPVHSRAGIIHFDCSRRGS